MWWPSARRHAAGALGGACWWRLEQHAHVQLLLAPCVACLTPCCRCRPRLQGKLLQVVELGTDPADPGAVHFGFQPCEAPDAGEHWLAHLEVIRQAREGLAGAGSLDSWAAGMPLLPGRQAGRHPGAGLACCLGAPGGPRLPSPWVPN